MAFAFSAALSLRAFSDLFLVKWVPSSLTFTQRILHTKVSMNLMTDYLSYVILLILVTTAMWSSTRWQWQTKNHFFFGSSNLILLIGKLLRFSVSAPSS